MSVAGRDVTFKADKHAAYLSRFLKMMPQMLEGQESLRVTFLFFAVSGLDILNSLDRIDAAKKKDIIDWVYGLQVGPDENDGELSRCGFQGAPNFNLQDTKPQDLGHLLKKYRCANVAMNYSALSVLVILGDDLSRVNKKALLEGVRAMQQEDGCFSSCVDDGESDMRFVFCAVAVCYILNDWSVMNVQKVMKYIHDSMSYEFGIAQSPGLEAHGGSTYCAIAALSLMGKLTDCFSSQQITRLTRWCFFRQESGFHGRPNKPDDTCYSFWIGATLKILGVLDHINLEENKNYVLSCQNSTTGGFSKWVDDTPDPLHTCLALCGLSLMNIGNLLEIHPALNVSRRAHEHLKKLHVGWES